MFNVTVNGSVAKEWILNNQKYYGNITTPVYIAEMNVAAKSFHDILDKYPNIELIMNTGSLVRESLEKTGTRIVQLRTRNSERIWKASVWIDASYDGDLVQFSNTSFTWGRESQNQYNESYAGVRSYEDAGNFLSKYPVNATWNNGSFIPYVSSESYGSIGSSDDHLMTFTYRLCITNRTEKQAPFFKPDNYDSTQFILLQRYIDSVIASGKYPQDRLPFTAFVDPREYTIHGCPIKDIYDLNGRTASAVTTDAINLNVGYINGTDEDRRRISQQTSDYILGFLWYLLTSPDVPEYTRNDLKRFGLCKDQWPENRHMTPQLYIREGLRLVNDHVFTQHDIVAGLCRNDTIALGSWTYEMRAVRRIANRTHAMNEGQFFHDIDHVNGSQSGPTFEIPHTIILPKRDQTTNLIVPVCHAASHVAYSATRLEPTFMLLGGAAGYFAAFAVLQQNIDVQSVDVRQVQQALTSDGVHLHYPPNHCQ